jgi:hypothetical protein
MQQDTVMVPMTVMVPQTVYRPRTILEQVPAAPAAAPAAPAQLIPPAPSAEPLAAPVQAAPQFAPSRDCAGSPNTQMALMALMLAKSSQASPRRAVAAAPSSDLQNRVTNLEAKLDRLILALEKTK